MYAEHVSWTVGEEQGQSCLNILQLLCHHMDSSGGLIKALAGTEITNSKKFALITFWKGWEDLMRFLSSPRSAILSEAASNHYGGGTRPSHFEIVSQFPKEEVVAANSGTYWAHYNLHTDESHIDAVLERVRQAMAKLSHEKGLESAAMWVDRSNPNHVALATHWSADRQPEEHEIKAALEIDSEKMFVNEESCRIYRIQVLDPRMAGVA